MPTHEAGLPHDTMTAHSQFKALGTLTGASYQVFHHSFYLFLGHIYILRGAFQGDLVLAFRKLDVNLPHKNKGQ